SSTHRWVTPRLDRQRPGKCINSRSTPVENRSSLSQPCWPPPTTCSSGRNTVSKQAGPNTGTDEHGNVVDIASATDGVHFDYPAVASIIQVTVTHTTDTHFLITIKDVSTSDTLMTSAGNRAAPLSPGVWVVHNAANPLFTAGMPD